jgi:hypothetical protein
MPQARYGVFATGAPHIEDMALRHPHADATYRVVSQKDLTYGVEVAIPDTHPTMVTSFATKQDAEAWIAKHRMQAESGVPERRWYKKAEKG